MDKRDPDFKRWFATVARFPSQCARCGAEIRRGVDRVVYRPRSSKTSMCVSCADSDPDVIYKTDEIVERVYGPPAIACPVPGCVERPVANCDFCPSHQAEINRFQWELL